MRVYSRTELLEQAELLSTHSFCQSPADIAERLLDRLKPRESITTLDYSQRYRVIRKPDGTKTDWSLDLTPYLAPIMAAHDNPEIQEIIVPKPGRCGGTVVAENHALKRLDFGPLGDVMWYLAGPGEVQSYADRIFAPLFEDHSGVAARIGRSPSDNKKTMKRVGSQTIELMVMSRKTTTNRQAAYIVFDEPDSYHRDFRSNFLEQGRQRQRMLGSDRKIYACAHPDLGWSGGIAAAWVLSTQGIFVMQCPECGGHGSPYPTKYWAEIPRFRLFYEQSPEGTPIDQRLALAGQTAALLCPHCGVLLDEAQRASMSDEGTYMHKGQTLDIQAGILGEPDQSHTWGFWIHVLMAKQVGMSDLAREMEGALEHRERTGRTDKLKEILVRTFGEVFEGSGSLKGLDARTLQERTRSLAAIDTGPVDYRLGEVPDGVRFLVLAVDVGGNKFDIMVRGFDLERRSWIIERRTIRQRMHDDGILRDIDTSRVQDDWNVLIDEIDRLYPMQSDPSMVMPVAVTMIDSGDGNVTWKAYEFARRMDTKRWGDWRKVYCLKGMKPEKAPLLDPRPTSISTDSDGKPVLPTIKLQKVGGHGLKTLTLEDLDIEDNSPGQVFFPVNMASKAYEELFNEVLVEGKWVRNGPNETLDLMGYTEAARLMLEPDRKSRNWEWGKQPIWARPIALDGEVEVSKLSAQPSPTQTRKSDFASRIGALNRG